MKNGELLQTTEDGKAVSRRTATDQPVQQSESYTATPHTLGALMDGKQLQNLRYDASRGIIGNRRYRIIRRTVVWQKY